MEKERLSEKAYERKKKYNIEYAKKNVVSVGLNLNKTTDADIIACLKRKNKQQYIKDLIRKDIANGKVDR